VLDGGNSSGKTVTLSIDLPIETLEFPLFFCLGLYASLVGTGGILLFN
jgi:hypothetical protein